MMYLIAQGLLMMHLQENGLQEMVMILFGLKPMGLLGPGIR